MTATNEQTPRRARHTRHQEAVLALVGSSDAFRAVRDVQAMLREQGTEVSISTLYRTLRLLEREGLVDSVHDEAGAVRYRRAAPGDSGCFLVCRVCDRADPVDLGEVEEWAVRTAGAEQFADVVVHARLRGVCGRCAS
ncbi:Fur family transcriptional regulator [Sanguibacter suaedae]|uniref:Transcriptional repressor n=1 Tax=Sanguibacter suaedae TaxID=2795737 RepID=A0A934I1T8_9MICO|nr:transcriptional repressor [Sanguibacter suaedae]MBI9113628.1 transcriptional repressor [Sanguibacter suaedae]